LGSLGYLDKLAPPNEICGVGGEATIIREAGPKDFFHQGKAAPLVGDSRCGRSLLPLTLAAIRLRVNGKSHDAANEEIILERH
jgi:hypothetical protein